MVSKPAVLSALLAAAACTTVTSSESLVPVKLVHGEQIKIWGVEARHDGQTIKLAGQVDRSALPRGPLREHVHVEVLNDAGVVVATQDATLYPFTSLREMGTARVSATILGNELGAGGVLRLLVVDGVPHD